MIPKKIHYCWFGGNPLPKLAKKCIKSWKKYCPDYEIIRWDESNFDISSAPLYVQQAYNAKKWAFVTDYVRLYAMVTQGGIYMDTDVEIVKPLDSFLHHQAFSGFESEKDIPTGIMACQKNFPLFLEFLEYYNNIVFLKDDGEYNLITNVIIMTDITEKHGLIRNGCFQVVSGFALYPKDYYCPIDLGTFDLKKTENTVAIHWFGGSWLPDEMKLEKKKIIRKKKKQQRDKWKYQFIYFPNRALRKILGQEKYEKMKKKIFERKRK